MYVLHRIWVALLCLGLAACAGYPPANVSRSNVTGLAGGWSAVERVTQPAATRHHVIVGRAYWISGPGGPVQTVRLGKIWDGVHDRLRVDDVFAAGIALPFQPSTRTEPFAHDMADHTTLIGTLNLSDPDARARAADGL